MSGPLRRTKRSRPADGGEPLEEGLAAEPEGAATTPETPPPGDERAAPAEPTPPSEAASSEGAAEAPSPKPAAASQPRATAAEKPAEAAARPGRAGAKEAPVEATSAGAANPAVTGQEPPVETAATEPSVRSPGAAEPPEVAGDEPPADTAATEPPATSLGSAAAAESQANEPRPAAPGSEPTAEIPSPAAETAGDAGRKRWRPFRKPARAEQARPEAPPPVLLADPDTPAGLDPAEAPLRPPAGRRGRLRRRLRYLRRARELMLRDLGGLLYEVHRTGGGNADSHATVVGAKVQRIAGLDAEAHALETALRAPRGETVVFEPGVGGTCDTCGELYGSDARFCSNCGASIGTGAPGAPAAGAPTAESTETGAGEPARRAFWRRAARPAEDAPASEDTAVMKPPDESAASGDERTAVLPPDETARGADDTAAATPDEKPAAPGGDPPTSGAEAASPPRTEESHKPFSGLRNGRRDDTPPGLSSGDPLASRESRS